MLNKIQQLSLFFLVLSVGCDSNENKDTNAGGEPPNMIVKKINASSHTDFVYYNLSTQAIVANVADDWHIGFKRNSVIVNGGSSGTGLVTAAIADGQSEYYDAAGNAIASVFNSATEAGELSSLINIVDASGLTFVEDKNRAQIAGDGAVNAGIMDFGWYSYNTGSHVVTANPDAYWIVRSGAGNSYARFRVTGLTQNGHVFDNLSVELHIQSVGSAAFDTTATLFAVDFTTPVAASICYDFDTKSAIACSSADWDLRFDKNRHVWTNGGAYGDAVSGAASKQMTQTELLTYVSGTDYSPYLYAADKSGGIFLDEKFYVYASHKIKLNYRVYVVDTGTEKHKLQITSYYATGVSGNYRIRHQQLK